MLLDLKDRALLRDGQKFPLTMHFEKSGEVTVESQCRSRRRMARQCTPTPNKRPSPHAHAPA
jgi:hypothetical protein